MTSSKLNPVAAGSRAAARCMRDGHRRWSTLALAVTATLSAAASAAPQAQDASVLEEVIVSVERVEQSLQSYAGTAAVVSQATLDQVGATDLLDLPALMPGLEITNYEGNTEIYVRGIGSNANTELGDPAIATHLDDVYVPRPRGLGVAFFDLERVEVNVGPQGTVRGRNALGGSMNIVSRKPKLETFEGYAEAMGGNYDQSELRGAINVPLGSIAAARVAVYSAKHDAYVENTGPLDQLLGWESQDDFGARAHFLLEPNDDLSVLLTGDFLNQQGTGSRGVDFYNSSVAGNDWDKYDDPRRVNQTGFSPVQDTDNWGLALNATYRTDWFNVQYIGGYRDLKYTQSLSNSGRNYDLDGDERMVVERAGLVDPDGPLADDFVQERYYGAYGALIWDATSESRTHELRFTSPDDADRVTWAVGFYKFKEEQQVFLGIPLDYSTDLPYLEFNQGNVVGDSKSAYADLTWKATDRLSLTAGARYSEEGKERDGFNYIAGINTNGVAVRTGTPGFRMTGLSRANLNPDADGDGTPNTINDLILLYQAGISSYGIDDTLDEFLAGGCVQASQFQGTCAGYPGLSVAFGGATVQTGENSDSYIDWRFRAAFDITDDNMVYFLVATGNKAPSFNDTVDLDTGPGENLYTPPVGPEKNTMFEIGSKNTLTVAGNPMILNASAYYLKYTDQVFSTLVGIEQLDDDPNNDAGCEDMNPTTPCSTITLNQNIGEATNMGVQFDASYNFGLGFNVAGTLLWQDTEYADGSVVNDGRRSSPIGGTLQVDLGGNELPRTPPWTLNLRFGQEFPLGSGTMDWVASGTYKSSYFLTAFNGGSGRDGAKEVTTVDAAGVATGYGADLLRLYDEVDGYVHLDLGVGYTTGEGNVRVEAFLNNATDEAHASQATIDGGTQEFVFNPPRTYGARIRVSF
ncbi:iron complex outermembrane receptor protein [Povalibacter uvarum]|uniref:Iron complex outermembrane receptor protein n=1 Tax=Povalibacter uvarum TaxID=732238 RepID=A0A841HRP3_9GAMM|nr:TonB-dependent receptor [Povalibacter uvarum]MBB6095433.1 iron complex outermembrane receptor protein [Povalibacter uvarum]